MNFLQEALKALPQAAQSPYAFVAYLGVIIVWVIIALRIKPLQSLLAQIQSIPAGERRQLIETTLQTPLPPNLSAGQWLKFRRQLYVFYAFITLVAAAVIVFAIAVTQLAATPSIYRLRVTVTDSQGVPVEDAKVWSSIGGELKKVSGGWQFDIPTASVPKDKKLIIYAEKKTAFLKGEHKLQLGEDRNPAITIQLEKDTSTTVRGIVQEYSGQAIPRAMVSVIGYGEEAVTTSTDGSFVLPAHAAIGQSVRLHVEKEGYVPVDQYHPAGDEPAVIILEKK